jgi:hypothetical protein
MRRRVCRRPCRRRVHRGASFPPSSRSWQRRARRSDIGSSDRTTSSPNHRTITPDELPPTCDDCKYC